VGTCLRIGFGRSSEDRISLADLVRVLNTFADARQGAKLDLLAGVTCRMSKIETAYELQAAVRFLVASQVGIPFVAWPYKAFLTDLIETPSLGPEQLGKAP